MRHILRPSPETVHWGYFDADLKPALRVKTSDIVDVYTIAEPTPAVERDFGDKVPRESREISRKVEEKGLGRIS